MLRAVIDTNVLVSALIRKGTPFDCVRQAGRKYLLIFSPETLSELRRALRYPKLAPFGLTVTRRQRYVRSLINRAEEVDCSQVRIGTLERDPSDTMFLACCAAGKADLLVTGDADLLTLHRYRSTRILSPRQFLSLLNAISEAPVH